MKNRTGILLTNIGTPDEPTPPAVRRYLKEFLSDPRVVQLPRIIWLPILHGYILRTRPKTSAKFYQKIWTKQGSPLLINTQNIAAGLRQKIGEDFDIAVGMHYGNPSIQSALEQLRHTDKIIILPLYPQYSATTTASSFDRVAHALKKWHKIPAVQLLDQYSQQPHFVETVAASIRDYWKTHQQPEHLLFSFHGIPKYYSKVGDPYEQQCKLSAEQIAKQLNLKPTEWSTAFQSRLGRAEWLTPYTDKVLAQFPENGIRHLHVVCPGFAADCLETLEEIAIRGKEVFENAGGKSFHYIPALNDSEQHLDMFTKIIATI